MNNEKEPDADLFCDSFVPREEDLALDAPADLPDLPDLEVNATLGEVTENGDSATAIVTVAVGANGEVIKGDYRLAITKENGDWKICGLEVGNFEIPGLGG